MNINNVIQITIISSALVSSNALAVLLNILNIERTERFAARFNPAPKKRKIVRLKLSLDTIPIQLNQSAKSNTSSSASSSSYATAPCPSSSSIPLQKKNLAPQFLQDAKFKAEQSSTLAIVPAFKYLPEVIGQIIVSYTGNHDLLPKLYAEHFKHLHPIPKSNALKVSHFYVPNTQYIATHNSASLCLWNPPHNELVHATILNTLSYKNCNIVEKNHASHSPSKQVLEAQSLQERSDFTCIKSATFNSKTGRIIIDIETEDDQVEPRSYGISRQHTHTALLQYNPLDTTTLKNLTIAQILLLMCMEEAGSNFKVLAQKNLTTVDKLLHVYNSMPPFVQMLARKAYAQNQTEDEDQTCQSSCSVM